MDCRFIQDAYHGVGRYTYNLLAGLCALPGEHRIKAFVDPRLPNHRFALAPLVASGKIELHQIAIPLYHPRELWAWPAQLRRTPVHVFHTPFFWAPWMLPCALVVTMHDMIFDRYPHYMPQRRWAPIYKVASRVALRRARRVIAVSDATKQDVLQLTRTPASKVVVVPEGVEASFAPVVDPQVRADVRQRYGLPNRYVLALGARRPHKNIERLVRAFATIAATTPHALVLIGTRDPRFSPTNTPELAQLHRAGRIVEIEHIAEADLPALYSMADLFVQPSLIEGFGLPVLEAMACGCAVACSNTSSLPEVAGDAALLFDPLREEEIAQTMLRILHSPLVAHMLAQRGVQRAQGFHWETASARTLAVYHAVAGRQHG